MALALALPLLAPVGYAAWQMPPTEAVTLTVRFLLALALTPAVAYLTVAGVFIYLHLRYEQPVVH